MGFEKATLVSRRDNPAKQGWLTGAYRERRGLQYWAVRWTDGLIEYLAEDQLALVGEGPSRDPYELIAAGRYGRSGDLRRSLTHENLSGRLANLVYSMGITNTEFFAHQYKPLLTLLESPSDGLLIADEVGLGKTIEAGLIWTELRAREDLRRLLVVCPAMLVEKWRDELKLRFGVEAVVAKAAELELELRQSAAHGPMKAWICSYSALRPPRGWKGEEATTEQKRSGREILAALLEGSKESEPILDLVIFDEAHYMRNAESATYKLGVLLRDVSHYRVLLSATPINLANEDLLHLLQLCDPDHFQFPQAFQEILAANAPLVRARDAALYGEDPTLVRELLEASKAQELLSDSRQLAALLIQSEADGWLADSASRVELATSLERINLLGHVLTRTRKREVQVSRPIRAVKTEAVPMSKAEARFYDYVTAGIREYAASRGISDGFLLATPQRQVCSSAAAFVRSWSRSHTDIAGDLEEEAGDTADLDRLPGVQRDVESHASLRSYLEANKPADINLNELSENDTKFERLRAVLQELFKENSSEKVVLFTSFRATARYLQEKLTGAGIVSRLVWGNMHDEKYEVLLAFRENPSIRVLISTEVAAEGVDLQFCRVLVNYDLPWNPMRVEQRIGRIDRLGQHANQIHIWNLFYANTIDERIINRLLTRLKIFTSTLGEAEPVVGETIQRLEADLLTRPLSKAQEEEMIDRAAQALDYIRVQQERLEQNAAQLVAHGGLLLDRIQAAQELRKSVTERDLETYVRDFLAAYAPGHLLVLEAQELLEYTLKLPDRTALELEDFCRRNGLVGETLLSQGTPRRCRFLNRIDTRRRGDLEIIHQFHPLVRFINERLRDENATFFPIVAVQLRAVEPPIVEGTYLVLLHRWTFEGVKTEEWLQSRACGVGALNVLEQNDTEILLSRCRLDGVDWLEAPASTSTDAVESAFDELDEQLRRDFERLKLSKTNENEDRAALQVRAIEDHLRHRTNSYMETRARHAAAGRASLVKATQGRIDRLRARMELQRERVRQAEKMKSDDRFVCACLVKVGGKNGGSQERTSETQGALARARAASIGAARSREDGAIGPSGRLSAS